LKDSDFSLYIHIPFCSSLCDYCDFYSEKLSGTPGAFINALLTDIEYQLEFYNVKKVSSLYIGGGTPSVLGGDIRRLTERLKELLGGRTGENFEFTVEANPETASGDFLETLKACGANRISVGVQTFNEPSRRAVNRAGDVSKLPSELSLISRFFDNFSADLITGLPFQNTAIVLEDVKRVLDFGPSHISLYSLVPDGDGLRKNIALGKYRLPDGDSSDSMWLAAKEALEKAGYSHYEVSNFALPGKQCAHNLRYWRMENWLGAGPSASGTIIDEGTGTGKRTTFPANAIAYTASKNPHTDSITENLSRRILMQESLLMGYRCSLGPDNAAFRRRFGCGIEECIPASISRFKEKGFFLEKADDSLPLPAPVMTLFLNRFLEEALDELDLYTLSSYLS
jgi:oxygen-independent coproporphyrinogen-3 oxidase